MTSNSNLEQYCKEFHPSKWFNYKVDISIENVYLNQNILIKMMINSPFKFSLKRLFYVLFIITQAIIEEKHGICDI